jgi:hypothetical protein
MCAKAVVKVNSLGFHMLVQSSSSVEERPFPTASREPRQCLCKSTRFAVSDGLSLGLCLLLQTRVWKWRPDLECRGACGDLSVPYQVAGMLKRLPIAVACCACDRYCYRFWSMMVIEVLYIRKEHVTVWCRDTQLDSNLYHKCLSYQHEMQSDLMAFVYV